MLHGLGVSELTQVMHHASSVTLVYLQRDDGSSDTDASDPDKVAGLAAEFRRRANLLYTLLQSNKLQSSQRAPYLRQFLLRLNFNGFVENEAVKQLRQAGSMAAAPNNV